MVACDRASADRDVKVQREDKSQCQLAMICWMM